MLFSRTVQVGNKPIIAILLLLALVLSSCASKRKAVNTQTGSVYTITHVNVAALGLGDEGFASQLERGLLMSAGRPASYYGHRAKLWVRVLPIGSSQSANLFSLGSANVKINVRISDHASGKTLEAVEFSASSTSDDPTTAYIVIEEKLIAKIRSLIGLNAIPPHPVNVENDASMYAPSTGMGGDDDLERLDPTILYEPKARVADPLLNGQINAETKVKDLVIESDQSNAAMEKDAAEMKKLVEEEMAVKPEEKFVSEPKMEPLPQENDSELCIVTVENDCLATPGGNN